MIKYNSDNHLMVDLETMGSNPLSPILSLSVVRFNPYTGETFNSFNAGLDLNEQLKNGSIIDADTIMWWLTQSDLSRNELVESQKFPKSLSLFKFEWEEFINSLPYHKDKLIHWGKSPTFDQVILGGLLKKLGIIEPWKYNNTRDVRTIIDLDNEVTESVKFEGSLHVPLHDVLYQIKVISKVIKSIYYE